MMNKIFHLLEILSMISNSDEMECILSQAPNSPLSKQSTSRISNIYAYALDHFKDKITIKEMAEVAYLSEHTFCRYFKQNFKTTFSSFLNELRVNHASTLLIETNDLISEICFKSGFNNFTSFNKCFKTFKKSAPTEYRKKYQNIRIKQSTLTKPNL
ncbi:MAG: helix-turn-helix transcriptional regulator [Ekhidna sp.]|nr:helix-turn-helix transcriptional regulator [Ekhidna sp.]